MTPAGDEAERIYPDDYRAFQFSERGNGSLRYRNAPASVDTTERIVWSFDVLEINGAGGI